MLALSGEYLRLSAPFIPLRCQVPVRRLLFVPALFGAHEQSVQLSQSVHSVVSYLPDGWGVSAVHMLFLSYLAIGWCYVRDVDDHYCCARSGSSKRKETWRTSRGAVTIFARFSAGL